MTASLYSIAKAYLLQSKYKTNNTNNETKKNNCVTNIESHIFIQEEINSITNSFTSWFFESFINFMLSGDDFLSKSGVIRLIWLMNACLCTVLFFFSGSRNEFYRVPDLCYLDKWSIWYRPCRIRSLWLLILNLTKMLSFIIMSYLVEIISCRIFIFKSFIKFKFFLIFNTMSQKRYRIFLSHFCGISSNFIII